MVLIEFYDIWRRIDDIFIEQDIFRLPGKGAV
jgi:hypothetical protein